MVCEKHLCWTVDKKLEREENNNQWVTKLAVAFLQFEWIDKISVD